MAWKEITINPWTWQVCHLSGRRLCLRSGLESHGSADEVIRAGFEVTCNDVERCWIWPYLGERLAFLVDFEAGSAGVSSLPACWWSLSLEMMLPMWRWPTKKVVVLQAEGVAILEVAGWPHTSGNPTYQCCEFLPQLGKGLQKSSERPDFRENGWLMLNAGWFLHTSAIFRPWL